MKDVVRRIRAKLLGVRVSGATVGSAFGSMNATTGTEGAVAKAGIKMLFPIAIFIPPVLFIITLAPDCVLQDLRVLARPLAQPVRAMPDVVTGLVGRAPAGSRDF